MAIKWMRGSLFDNIDKFANSLGYENAAIVMQLAMVPWDSPEERDIFIASITERSPQGGNSPLYSYKKSGR